MSEQEELDTSEQVSLADQVIDQAVLAGANAYDHFIGRGTADLRPTPSVIVSEGPQRIVHRYLGERYGGTSEPVLLVPPLAAPASCFDLRRGCSVAEHLLRHGRHTYLVDYGEIRYSDRELGLEHWVNDVLPDAVDAVLEDSGASSVQLVGWCLGGIFSLLCAAATSAPISAIAIVASPFDFKQVRLLTPLRPATAVTGGRIIGSISRLLGGAPAPLVKRGYWLAGFDKQLTKPYQLIRHIGDRDFLAQIEAVDQFMDGMLAYPGRTFNQLYQRFFIVNDLADGKIKLSGREIDLADIDVPVLSIAGTDDGIAPVPAVHHVGELLPNSPDVRLELAPGGHLGVLTGRAARTTTWPKIDGFLDVHADTRKSRRNRESAA